MIASFRITRSGRSLRAADVCDVAFTAKYFSYYRRLRAAGRSATEADAPFFPAGYFFFDFWTISRHWA